MPDGVSAEKAREDASVVREKLKDIEAADKLDAAKLEEALKLVDKSLESKKGSDPAKLKWIKEAVSSSLSQAEKSGQSYQEVSDGSNSQREGIPVDGLIESLIEGVDADVLVDVYPGGDLRQSVKALREGVDKVADLDPANAGEGRQQLLDAITFVIDNNNGASSQDDLARLRLVKQLLQSSERYSDVDHGDSSSDSEWRVKLEESFIADENDYRHGEIADGDLRAVADKYLKQRREAFLIPGVYSKTGDQLTDAKMVVGGGEDKDQTAQTEEAPTGIVPSAENGKIVPVKENENDKIAIAKKDEKDKLAKIEKDKDEKLVTHKPGEEHIIPYVAPNENIVPVPSSEPVIDLGETEPEPHPESQPAPEKQERIILADASEIAKAMAWRIAENRLNEIINYDTSPMPPGILRRMWRGVRKVGTPEFWQAQFAKLGEQGYLTKFYREALAEIDNNQDLQADIRARLRGESEGLTSSNPEKDEHYRMLDAVVREVQNEVIEADEQGEDLVGRGQIFSELINRHMLGEFADRNEFEAAARETIQQAIADGEIDQEEFSIAGRERDAEGLLYASNLWEIAENYRNQALEEIGTLTEGELTPEQQESLQGIIGGIGNLDIRLATKFQDLNEARARRPGNRGFLSIWERAASWSRTRPVLGAIVNPTTVGFISGLATRTALKNSALFGAGAALAGAGVVGTFGLPLAVGAGIAGTLAYVHRRRNLTFDRGVEQRREVIGQQGEGQRASRLREFGFGTFSGEAEQLLTEINSGNEGALIEAAGLLEAERILRESGRPTDLIWASAAEGNRSRSNLVPKVDLKVAVRENIPAGDPTWDSRVQNVAADFVERVRMNDDRFERYRVREGLRAGAITALTAGTLGAIGQEAVHGIEWRINAEAAAQRITLIDYIAGRRPNIEFAQIGENQFPADMIQAEPDGTRFVNVNTSDVTNGDVVGGYVHMVIGPDGNMSPDISKSFLPEGYSYDVQSGELSHVVSQGLEGGPLTTENWDQLREQMASKYPDLFSRTHVSWTKFYENGNPPVGNSYEAGYLPNSEGTELQMDFHHGTDGYSISFERMAGHMAFGSGGEFRVHPNTPILVTIGPRDLASSHEVISAIVTPEHPLQLHEYGDQFMTTENGQPILKDGWMITGCRPLSPVNGAGDGGVTLAGHATAEFRTGDPTIIGSPDTVENIPVEGGNYVPGSGNVDSPVPIPVIARNPIGNPRRGGEDQPQQQEPEPRPDQSQPDQQQVEEIRPEPQSVSNSFRQGVREGFASTRRASTIPEQNVGMTSEVQSGQIQNTQDVTTPEVQNQTETTDSRRDQWRALVGEASRVRSVANLPQEQRQQALVGLRQELIEQDVIRPEQAFFTANGQTVSYDQVTIDQDLNITQQLKELADDLDRRAIALGRTGRSARDRDELPDAA